MRLAGGRPSTNIARWVDSTDLRVSIAGPTFALPGERVVFSYTVSNDGIPTASDIVVTMSFPSGMQVDQISVGFGTCVDGPATTTCRISQIPSTGKMTFVLGGTFSQVGHRTATMTASLNQRDTAPGNNSASLGIDIGGLIVLPGVLVGAPIP